MASLQIRSAGRTDPGLNKKINEDTFLLDEQLGLYAVFDGVGGNKNGDVAAEISARAVRETLKSEESLIRKFQLDPSPAIRHEIAKLLDKAIQNASARVFAAAEADSTKLRMATTASVLLIGGKYAALGHVGDSRIYLLRAAKSHLLTQDHSYAYEMLQQGLWTTKQAANSPYANALTRAVGLNQFVQVDTTEIEMIQNDSFLVCSDGLSRYFSNDEDLVALVRDEDPGKCVETLVDLAKTRGGVDNITSILIRVGGGEKSTAALDLMKRSDVLGKVPLFRYFTFPELLKVLSLASIQSCAPGTLMLKEGTEGQEMYIIVSGSVEILKGGLVIASRGKGALFGEMGILEDTPRSATVRASEPTIAMVITRHDIVPFLRREPTIAMKLLWALGQDLSARVRATSSELAEVKALLNASGLEVPFSLPRKQN